MRDQTRRTDPKQPVSRIREGAPDCLEVPIVLCIEHDAPDTRTATQFTLDGTRPTPNNFQPHDLGQPAASTLQDLPEVARRLNPGRVSDAAATCPADAKPTMSDETSLCRERGANQNPVRLCDLDDGLQLLRPMSPQGGIDLLINHRQAVSFQGGRRGSGPSGRQPKPAVPTPRVHNHHRSFAAGQSLPGQATENARRHRDQGLIARVGQPRCHVAAPGQIVRNDSVAHTGIIGSNGGWFVP